MIGSSCRLVVSNSVPGALPLVVMDHAHSDVRDTLDFISTYRLRKYFEFSALLSEKALHPNDVYPSGDFIVVDATVSLLVEHFSHLTKKQLIHLGQDHSVDFMSGARKEVYRHLLLTHHCTTACTRTPFVFRNMAYARADTSKPIFPSSEELDQHKRTRIETRRRRDDVRRTAQSQSRARQVIESCLSAAGETTSGFPPNVTTKERDSIIAEWMETMDLKKFTQMSCAVCGQRRCAKDIKVVASDEVNLKLLQNPYLPEKCLPTNYDIQVYEGAILWYKGLHDCARRGDLDMCVSCRHELVALGRQPLDSLANFQYYGHEALSNEVREAFNHATTFDIMMVARARATRITHLYSSKTEGPMAGSDPEISQLYNKGNVAILPQESVELRNALPPPFDDVQKAMCAVFVGSKVKPTIDNIKKLSPVLVSKSRIRTMIDFLLTENDSYLSAGLKYSQDNMDDLFVSSASGDNESVPRAVELCHLPPEVNDPVEVGTSGYTDRYVHDDTLDPEDIVMDSVAYTDGDDTPKSYHHMKATALAWCLARKKFMKMQGGTGLLSERDPGFLTYLFPHLDPWGIGGFFERHRSKEQHISFDRQVRNLLLQEHMRFQNDAGFAYICWNIMQKRDVNIHASFRAGLSQQAHLAEELAAVAPDLPAYISKWTNDKYAKASGRQEKRLMRLLNRLKLVAHDIKGSAGYKQCRRNEIRALIKTHGTPALFVTLNPSDLTNPLVGVMSGLSPEEWKTMTPRARAKLVAKHPGPAAQFFDTMIRSFLDIIVRPGEDKGLFGRCSTYYGMVEAQGRGTLHCHMLLWIEGNPNPQELRDRMAASPEFQKSMFQWIESIIKCQLPSTLTEILEHGSELPRPPKCADPRLESRPRPILLGDDENDHEFESAFREFVERLAIECNWHEHKDTCFIHLKPGEARDDSTCRMRIDGSTRSMTTIDPETESILLKRLHPRINNFNDVVIFLMECNMDIKYIGSGEAAKALVFYITDYITKSSLATHIGLGALAYAIRQNDMKFDGVLAPRDVRNRSLFNKTVNAMMARHEMSHQQILSYMIGGGDHYKFNQFRILKWGDISRFVGDEQVHNADQAEFQEVGIVSANEEKEVTEDSERDRDDDDNLEVTCEEQVVLDVQEGKITGSNDVLDYRFRSTDLAFDQLCLWEHAELVHKVSRKSEEARNARYARPWPTGVTVSARNKPGRALLPRGEFSSADHPQYASHVSRLRGIRYVPVLLGPSIPSPDKSKEEYERWCRAMLILFKPWRCATDLKPLGVSWSSAFNSTTFTDRALDIMKNMNVENECKDARETHRAQKRSGKINSNLMGGLDMSGPECDMSTLGVSLNHDVFLDEHVDDSIYDPDVIDEDPAEPVPRAHENELIGEVERSGLYRLQNKDPVSDSNKVFGQATCVQEGDRAILNMHSSLMGRLHANKRPSAASSGTQQEGNSRYSSRRRKSVEPALTIQQLEKDVEIINVPWRSDVSTSPAEELENIIREWGLKDNPEQERAVRIVGEHFVYGREDQLLMYVGGIGGSGKSYVVKAIVELFKRCGASERLLLSAPTGCAAVLIGGYTIHALTFLPKSKHAPKQLDLEAVWRLVKYLVIDEISIVDSLLLSQISHRISIGRASDEACLGLPYGGVNVIFTGDMGQLRPVKAKSLFSYELVKKLSPNVAQTTYGQGALHGACLWRQINTVVELKMNWRAKKDPEFVNLLARVRAGIAWDGLNPMTKEQVGDGRNYDLSDYKVICGRQIQLLKAQDRSALEEFMDAPIIVNEKVNRDALNLRAVKNFAANSRQDLFMYHSRDRYRRCALEGDDRSRMWRMPSRITKDSLGMLPLVPGMRVMVTENVATSSGVANGAEGVLKEIKFESDEDGNRYAACAYVHIPGCKLQAPGLPPEIVPIMPSLTTFTYKAGDLKFAVSRTQLPLLPAYAYTDYKAQGRSLAKVLVDLSACRSLQSVYVMLSRAGSLKDIGVVRWFPPKKINQRLQEEFRVEFERLRKLDEATKSRFEARSDPFSFQY